MRSLLLALFLLFSFPCFAEKVDVELVLIVDNSSSISSEEIIDQRESIRNALRSPNVITTIQSNHHQKIAISLIEFGEDTKISIPWSIVKSRSDLVDFTNKFPDIEERLIGSTYTGGAFRLAFQQIYFNEIESTTQAIILITDGKANDLNLLMDQIETFKSPSLVISALYIQDKTVSTGDLISHITQFILFGYKKKLLEFNYVDIEKLLVHTLQFEVF